MKKNLEKTSTSTVHLTLQPYNNKKSAFLHPIFEFHNNINFIFITSSTQFGSFKKLFK